jgi:hypothetical protein
MFFYNSIALLRAKSQNPFQTVVGNVVCNICRKGSNCEKFMLPETLKKTKERL